MDLDQAIQELKECNEISKKFIAFSDRQGKLIASYQGIFEALASEGKLDEYVIALVESAYKAYNIEPGTFINDTRNAREQHLKLMREYRDRNPPVDMITNLKKTLGLL